MYVLLSPTWEDLTQGLFIVRVLGKSEFGHEPRVMPCCTMLVISFLSYMWARLPYGDMDSQMQSESGMYASSVMLVTHSSPTQK